ncbi:MAG: GTPase HflX [Myxococcales bacterium]|nr:GTPase HflX [Myxococcales bacterium]
MTEPERPACVLVAVQLPDVDDTQHAADLAELGRLCATLGLDVVATITQRRPNLAHTAVLGEGKLGELAALTGGSGHVGSTAPQRKDKARLRREAEEGDHASDHGVDEDDAPSGSGTPRRKPTVVVIDHELTPSQIRNLERATSAEVMDRTGVIVEIFHRHAKTREARLQVEIARLTYVAPRLRESGGGAERQAGRGAGESALELDRRKIRDRIAELREELAAVQRDQDQRRQNRRQARRVALVGYTNAGKSSLMRALTGSDVLVADKLFATLDTTVRALHPEVKPRVLVSDTVGFIQKLPHDLVASFKSTLDEAHEASLLLYVVDASDPTHEHQLEVTREVLAEIGADAIPSKLVLNKCDCLDDLARAALRAKHPRAILLSARVPADVARLRQILIDFFDEGAEEVELVVPYGKQSLVAQIHERARVLSETWDEAGAHLLVRAQPVELDKLRSLLSR